MGYVAIDLTPLVLASFTCVVGWYNITDWLGKCRGQINVSVTPLQNVDKTNYCAFNQTTEVSFYALPTRLSLGSARGEGQSLINFIILLSFSLLTCSHSTLAWPWKKLYFNIKSSCMLCISVTKCINPDIIYGGKSIMSNFLFNKIQF